MGSSFNECRFIKNMYWLLRIITNGSLREIFLEYQLANRMIEALGVHIVEILDRFGIGVANPELLITAILSMALYYGNMFLETLEGTSLDQETFNVLSKEMLPENVSDQELTKPQEVKVSNENDTKPKSRISIDIAAILVLSLSCIIISFF